jgi:hypothetical protein
MGGGGKDALVGSMPRIRVVALTPLVQSRFRQQPPDIRVATMSTRATSAPLMVRGSIIMGSTPYLKINIAEYYGRLIDWSRELLRSVCNILLNKKYYPFPGGWAVWRQPRFGNLQ